MKDRKVGKSGKRSMIKRQRGSAPTDTSVGAELVWAESGVGVFGRETLVAVCRLLGEAPPTFLADRVTLRDFLGVLSLPGFSVASKTFIEAALRSISRHWGVAWVEGRSGDPLPFILRDLAAAGVKEGGDVRLDQALPDSFPEMVTSLGTSHRAVPVIRNALLLAYDELHLENYLDLLRGLAAGDPHWTAQAKSAKAFPGKWGVKAARAWAASGIPVIANVLEERRAWASASFPMTLGWRGGRRELCVDRAALIKALEASFGEAWVFKAEWPGPTVGKNGDE